MAIHSRSGSTLLLVALMLPMLLAAVGVAVDLGRLYAVQTKAQNAADAATRWARWRPSHTLTDVDAEVKNSVQRQLSGHLYLGSTVSVITTVSNGDKTVYTTNFTVTVPTTIMNYFGDKSSTIGILSQVTVGLSTSAQNLELAMVLDNTPVDERHHRFLRHHQDAGIDNGG